MLTAIVQFSLRFRGVIIALAFILAGYGLYSLSRAKYDVFPEFAPPQVVIQTEAPGLAPEQVEVLVSQPIENAVNGIAGIESLRSGSVQGLSFITITFRPDTDIYLDRQMVAERLTTLAGQLPREAQAPVMTPLTSSTSIVQVVGLTSERLSLMALRTIADWTVKQRLLAVPGVAKVAVFGGEMKQFQIRFRPERLVYYGLALEDVLAAARRATGVRGAGFIDNGNQRIVIQTQAQSLTAPELARTALIRGSGADVSVSVTLGDVADVAEAPEPPIGAAAIMGQPGVVFMISAQYGANTLEVTKKIDQALEELGPALKAQGAVIHSDLFRPANFIETATGNMRSSLLIGAALVIMILALFLFNLRTAAISAAAIPLSLLAAVTVMERLGMSLNTMTLGGLAIAVGIVVDDAIIDVENILRRLRENRALQDPRPAIQVVLDASIEVRHAVAYASLAVALVFVPVLTMSGLAGRLFAPLGIAFILATLASLLVALTVTPALCLALLRGREFREPPLVHWLQARYSVLLQGLFRRPRMLMTGAAFLVAAGIAVVPFFSGSFLPELKEGHFIVHMSAVPGTSLTESLQIGRRVAAELLKIPSVRSVAQRAGRAERADDILGTQDSEFEVDLKPLKGEEAEFAEAEIRRVLSPFVGVDFSVNTFLTERVEETLSGYTAAVVINVFGNDLDILDKKAREVARVLSTIAGTVDLRIQSPAGTPQLSVRLKKERLDYWGFDPLTVLDAVRTAYEGNVVGQVYEGNRVFGVSVILDPRERRTIGEVGDLPLRNPAGMNVRLRELAEIRETSGRYVVLHEGARRVQTVTCSVTGRSISSFTAESKKRIASAVALPEGSYLEFTGTAAAQVRSTQELTIHSVLAGIGIVLLLSIVTGSGRNLLLILSNLPFALVGGALAVFGSGGAVSLGSMVGFVTLFGITLRNSIMMVSHYEHLVTVEGLTWGPEAAERGARERLAPILMTALVTALGLLPLALGSGAPGREIEGPMAVVILGGLLTSTALNLLVLPTLALQWGEFGKKERSSNQARL
ncbi:MAG: efflux RND transporter permease subunit [Betaproteobacteria bacterium]